MQPHRWKRWVCLTMLAVLCGWFYFYFHLFHYRIFESSTSLDASHEQQIRRIADPNSAARSLSLEEQEEILKEDHRFLKVIKKKVEGHELALRKQEELRANEREDYLGRDAALAKLLNQTKAELANELLLLEGKYLRVEAQEKRFEAKMSANERLTSRKVRLGEMQLEQMEQWIGDVVAAVQRHNDRALQHLQDKVVEALLAISAKEEASDGDAGTESEGGQRKRALRAVIEEITNGDFFKDGDAYRPPDLLKDISRKRAGPTEAEKASGESSLTKFGVVAIATKDFSATDGEDELPLYEGEEVIVVHAMPSNVWWRVKNSEGREGLVPSSHLKWYDEEAGVYVAPGARWAVESVGAEVERKLKDKEREIQRLEDENARLRLLKGGLDPTAAESEDGTGDEESGNGEEGTLGAHSLERIDKRRILLQTRILPAVRRILKGFDGDDEQWEEMERRRYVWKNWKEAAHDLHSLHLYSGLHPHHSSAPTEELDHLWRKSGRHGMKHHLQVLLETESWKNEAAGRYLVYQPPPGKYNEHGGISHQMLALMEALAWAKLLDRTLVVPLFGDGSSDNYYHPTTPAMVYLNTTALQDYAPTASWAAFLNSFASGVEDQAKQLTPDLKGKLIDLVQGQAESQKMSIVYRPSDFAVGAAAAQKIDAQKAAAAAVAKVETLARKQKVVKVKEVQLSGNLADRGNLHTDMIKLKSAADTQQQEVSGGGDHRNYYFKSQGLSVARVDEIKWTSGSHSAGATGWTSDEERIVQTFGQGKYGQQELIIFNSLRGFYNVPPTFLHAILHAALRFPTPLVAKAREYIDALSEDGTAPYAAVHLRRGADYETYCRAVKDHEGDLANEGRVKITDRALVFDRCYTSMTDIIHRLTAIREMGNYTRIFVATDLTAQDGDDVLLSDLPWVSKLNDPGARGLFPAKFDGNHFAMVEMVVCAHAELFVGNLYSAFSQMTTHYRHVLGQPSDTTLFL